MLPIYKGQWHEVYPILTVAKQISLSKTLDEYQIYKTSFILKHLMPLKYYLTRKDK